MKKTLFRFRKINPNSILAFMNDEIYGSTPDQFNDPYDSLFQYDPDRLFSLLIADNEFVKYICKELVLENWQEFSNYSENDLIKIIKDKRDFLTPLNNYVLEVLSRLRRQLLITCFCEKNTKEIMWSHYADSGKGFVLEYSYKDIDKLSHDYLNVYRETMSNNHIGGTFPLFGINSVDYKSDRLDGTCLAFKNLKELLKEKIQTDNDFTTIARFQMDEDEFKQFVLYKDKSWEYESEIRLILPNLDLRKTYCSLGKAKPKAVYLGEFISFNDEYTICSIAKSKGIPVYKMYSSLDKKRFGLTKKQLTEKAIIKILNEFKAFNPYE